MLVTRNNQTIIIFICTMLLLVLVFRVVGSVRLSETIIGLKRKYSITTQKKQELETFENIELHFRQAKEFDEWWQAVCFAAEEMDFIRSAIPITNRDGTNRTLIWEKENGQVPGDEILRIIVPVRDRRSDSSLNIEIHVCANGSLESAGRRVALFTRLMDEHGVIALSQNDRI